MLYIKITKNVYINKVQIIVSFIPELYISPFLILNK